MSNPLKIVAVPMHPEGLKFVGIFAVISILLGLLWMPLFWVGLVLTIWCYYFFRNPVRSVPQQEGLVLSPADGVISLITKVIPPAEMGLGPQERVRVSVFMNVFNCHVNRAPMDGEFTAIHYHKGKFVNASLDKASEHNERNALTITNRAGHSIGVIQIAGLVARRIVCFTAVGDQVRAGERFGLIRFGSRLDVFLPIGVEPKVILGQTAVAGETVLADLADPTPNSKGTRI
ncbi:MAG: phosphatidylserine decarboxylase family protein [Rhodobacterales bacterium]|nr:MAG: phosphatidylserine decarboxylase family protein [Rhodobacterales bacterium]